MALALLGCAHLAFSQVMPAQVFREWTSLGGSKTTAKLLGFNEKTQLVKLEKKDGTVMDVFMNQFTVADQKFVKAQAAAGKPAMEAPATGQIKMIGPVTLDMRYQAPYGSGKLNEARLSPVPDGVTPDRTQFPVITEIGKSGDDLEEGIMSQLLWWDRIGFCPIPKAKTDKDKEKWLRLEFRCKTKNPEITDIGPSLAKYLPRCTPKLPRLNATHLSYSSNLETMATVTRGLDLAVIEITAYSVNAIAWGNPVVLISATPDGNISFLMWHQVFHGKLEPTPKDKFVPGAYDVSVFYDLKLDPDPANPKLEYIQKNKWVLRWSSSDKFLVFSPTAVEDPTPVADNCTK